MLRNARNWVGCAVLIGGGTGLLGCGSGSSDGSEDTAVVALGPNGDGIGTKPLAPPKFQFAPADPGRAVGIRAIVEVDGVEFETNPTELVLFTPVVAKRARPRSAPSRAQDGSKAFGSAEQGLAVCPAPGESVENVGTINGNVLFFTRSVGSANLFLETAVEQTFVFGREGLYAFTENSYSLSVPPELNVGVNIGLVASGGQHD